MKTNTSYCFAQTKLSNNLATHNRIQTELNATPNRVIGSTPSGNTEFDNFPQVPAPSRMGAWVMEEEKKQIRYFASKGIHPHLLAMKFSISPTTAKKYSK